MSRVQKKNLLLACLPIIAILTITLLWNRIGAQPSFDTAEEYEKYQLLTSASERFDTALNQLSSPNAGELQREAAEELVRFSASLDRQADALAAIDGYIQRTGESIDAKRALIAKARILSRLDRNGEADAIFIEAMKDATLAAEAKQAYSASLYERGAYESQAQFELERYANGESGSLLPTADALYYSVAEGALPTLQSDDSETSAILAALQSAASGDPATAVAALEALAAQPEADAALALYIASARLIGQHAPSRVKDDIARYITENLDEPAQTAEQVWRLSRQLIDMNRPFAQLVYIGEAAVNSPLIQDETVKAAIGPEAAARLFDIYLTGLAWDGRHDESMAVALACMGEYFPGTEAGAHAAFFYASQELMRAERHAEAEDLLYAVIAETDSPDILPFALYALAQIQLAQNRLNAAEAILNDVVGRIAPFDNTDLRVRGQMAAKLLERIDWVKRGKEQEYRLQQRIERRYGSGRGQ